MTVDIKALRELLARATPGPWRWSDWSATFGTVETPELMHRLTGRDPRPAEPQLAERGRWAGVHVLYLGETAENDADRTLIVAAVNALPQLLDMAQGCMNLLARVHRDGGQYTDEHGLAKSLDDADVKVARLIGEVERLRLALHRAERDLSNESRDRVDDLRDCEEHTAEVERLADERRKDGEIMTKVNDAIGRAGIHCAIYFWEAIDQIARERDAARAEVERLRIERDAALADGVLSQRVCDVENDNAQLRAEVERLRAALEWLDRGGGLGVLVHRMIREALDPATPGGTGGKP